MRDNLKNIEYFKKYINENLKSYLKSKERIVQGIIPQERILILKRSFADSFVNVFAAKYSLGHPINELKESLMKAIFYTHESWDGFWKIKTGNPTGSIVLAQYGLDAYDQMLWMLSLGYLLDVSEADFKKLVEVIDRDGVKDFLFEFIIRAKLKDRRMIAKESYQEFFGVPNTFEKLRQAINKTDKAKVEKLVKEFITKDWYKNHKNASWYNSHKSKHDIYFGYWSFETAAVVKIMGLDDSSFIHCQYYPKDLLRQETI